MPASLLFVVAPSGHKTVWNFQQMVFDGHVVMEASAEKGWRRVRGAYISYWVLGRVRIPE